MNQGNHDVLLMGTCVFDPVALTLCNAAGDMLHLRAQSMRVLAELARRRGNIVSRDDLIEVVWRGTAVTDDSLAQCIKDIRKAIRDPERRILETVVGRGYTLHVDLPAPASSLKPGVLIEKITSAGGSQAAEDLAADLHERLVLIMAPRSGVRIFTNEAPSASVDCVVRGRVSVSNNRARLFVSLSGLNESGNFYAESFTGDPSELDQLAEKVARKISSVVRIRVIAYDGERYAKTPNERLDLQQLIAKAHFFYSRITAPDTMIARAAMQAAVTIAPNDPKALALLAHSATQMHPLVHSNPNVGETDWAMSLADRAVAVGASSAFAFRTRANLRLWLLGDHEGCRDDCARALAVNPNFFLAHLTLATSDILTGSHMAGIERLTTYVCLTTIDQQYPYFQSLIGLAWFLSGHPGAAIASAREAHERLPRSSWHAMVYAVAASGDPENTRTARFRNTVRQLDLPFGHFRSLPFSRMEDVEALETALRSAGVSD